MQPIILHIPHSSTSIPNYNGYVDNVELIDNEVELLTDWYTHELFYSENDITVKADFSRIFCDVERFADDEQELMARYGMGVLYEKTDSGKFLRAITPELRGEILSKYYWPHHNRLENAVEDQLQQYGKSLIVDCHSFSDIPFQRDLNQQPNRPHINIGTDSFHTPKHLVDFTVDFFERHKLTVGINWPYSGTMVPLKYYQKDNRVNSIMIEVNRKLYLKSGSNVKLGDFNFIKGILYKYIRCIYS